MCSREWLAVKMFNVYNAQILGKQRADLSYTAKLRDFINLLSSALCPSSKCILIRQVNCIDNSIHNRETHGNVLVLCVL